MTSAREDGAFPWGWMFFRALDCGMSAAAFWEASPRAILTLYDCTREARKQPSGGRGNSAKTHKQEQPPQRLARLPR